MLSVLIALALVVTTKSLDRIFNRAYHTRCALTGSQATASSPNMTRMSLATTATLRLLPRTL